MRCESRLRFSGPEPVNLEFLVGRQVRFRTAVPCLPGDGHFAFWTVSREATVGLLCNLLQIGWVHDMDRRNKAITLARNGLDVDRTVAGVTERLAQLHYP